MKKSEVKLKRIATAQDIAAVLDDLAVSIRAGTVCLESGSEFVTLNVGEDTPIELEIEASQKKNKTKFEMELSWRIASPKMTEEDDLKISSVEPEITEPSPVETLKENETDTR